MATRYLRASGNWNGPVWADTSDGAAGSASTPTADDAVYINTSSTVTLTADAECIVLSQTSTSITPRINLSSHKLAVKGWLNFRGGTLDLGNGHLSVGSGHSSANSNNLTIGDSVTIIGGSSIITYEPAGVNVSLTLGNKEYNDFIINIGRGWSNYSVTLNITGSPTFRSLIIQSKNSAAHTVNFDDASSITTDKLVLVGSSSSNKLTVKTQTAEEYSDWWIKDSMYGQYVGAVDIYPDTEASAPLYLGSNSTATRSPGWLLQDPPKISTLVDPLTLPPDPGIPMPDPPEYNPNWTVSGGTVTEVTTGMGGGGYSIPGGEPT